ncbi:MAG: hypothetical protein MJA82_07480 [Clostridia bacterium]|nr:hypothetical protein [Clostridia bacterium]
MKNSIKIILFVIACTITLIGCSGDHNTSGEDVPIQHLQPSFKVDVNDLNELVGDADYVFVGYIDELVGTVYKNPVIIETENGPKEVLDPYTEYSVTVIDNIKGNLKKDVPIPMQKTGGLSKDESMYLLYENDELPEVGEHYILVAHAQPDGSLLISGPNSSIVLDIQSQGESVVSQGYQDYKEAYKNEIKTDRERFTSKYEE